MAKSKVPAKKHKKLKNKGIRLRAKKEIVIDRSAGLVFKSDKDLYEFFGPHIAQLEAEYDGFSREIKDDLREEELENINETLDLTLDEPAEIWHDAKTLKEFPIFHFIRPLEDLQAYHVAVTYVSDEDEPTFIFFHFVSRNLDLVSRYRRGDLVYDRTFEEVSFGAIDGDSLSEGDPLSMGLFLSMLKLRSESDVSFEQFQNLGNELREETIESADEIWRTSAHDGQTLVTFIKEFPDHGFKDLHYIAVTAEDSNSAVHTLLFSFPTNDETLIERYRHGENLQADEVVQESSH
ncbi:MAG: peptidase [Proteobacteria bacterium]|jgi:hypothetical protein|nr:peptidase [Pseudomonadota bacterium]